MQDPADNTFPIPGADNTQVPAGGSAVPPVANQQPGALPYQPPTDPNVVQPAAAPIADPSLTTVQPAPVAPGWQNQAEADAAQLPQGPDNYSLTPEPLVAAQPQVQEPVAQPAVNEGYTSVAQPATEPLGGNTLDLSGQQPVAPLPPVSQPEVPLQPVVDPATYQQPVVPIEPQMPGTLQAGVDVVPGAPIQTAGVVPPATDINGIPANFGMSNNSQAGVVASTQAKKKSGPLKFILIAVAVLAVIILISLALVFSARNSRKPAIQLNEEAVTPTEQANETATPAAIPAGYQQVTRNCFGFGVLLPTTVDFTKTTCTMAAKFGSASQYNLTVTPVVDSVADLQALVDKSKVGTITSQDDIKLGGVPAKKLIQQVNGLDQQTIVVIPANKTYQQDGKTITGFIINTSASDDTSKQASANLISTWSWK